MVPSGGVSDAAKRKAPPSGWLVIVGLGRLGSTLALQLGRRRWPVAAMAGRTAGRRRATTLGLPIATPEILAAAKVVFLCVPDQTVAMIADRMRPLSPRAALVHCAGALSLDVLESPKEPFRAIGSFHPVCAISGANDDLQGYAVAIAARSQWLRRLLVRLAGDLGLKPIFVREDRRPLYHAGAVLSAAGLLALADAGAEAFSQAGVPAPAAAQAILALMQSALRGAQARGLGPALTGPVPRGDSATIRSHLSSLPPGLRRLYAMLGKRALSLVKPQLPPAVFRDLARSLTARNG